MSISGRRQCLDLNHARRPVQQRPAVPEQRRVVARGKASSGVHCNIVRVRAVRGTMKKTQAHIVCNRQLFTHSPCSHIVLVHQLFSLVDAQGPVKGGLLRGCRRAHIYQTYDLINKSNIQCSPHPRSNAMTHTQVCMYVCLIMTLTQVRRLVRQTRRGDESDTVQGGGGSGDGSNASGQV